MAGQSGINLDLSSTKNNYMDKKRIALTLCGMAIGLFCIAQNPSAKSEFWSHVRFGGGIGLGFNNGGWNGSLAPSALYEFNDKFAAGIGLSVNYAKYDTSKFLAYGGSLITLYNPIQFLQLSGEFEQLRVQREYRNSIGILDTEDWVPGLFLGLGYRTQFVTVGIRYDILYNNEKSIYANAWMPFIRVYF